MDATLTHIPRGAAIYEAALEGLARINEALYRASPTLPDIYAANVRYRRERGEAWRHVRDVIGEGWGDCEDLAAARVGWLRARGGDSRSRVIVKRTGPRMTHALVRRGNGQVEDPSKQLGMGTPEGDTIMDPYSNEAVGWNPFRRKKKAASRPKRAALFRSRTQAPPRMTEAVTRMPSATDAQADEAYEESERGDRPDEREPDDDWEEIGADPSASAEISWTVERSANGWRGTVRVPLDMGRMLLVSRTAPTQAKAQTKAASAASTILNNPAVAALVPPQARFALNIVQSKKARDIAKRIMKLF